MRVTDKGVIHVAANEPLPVLAGEILAAKLGYEDSRYTAFQQVKDNVKDECAMARVLARRGLPPEDAWREQPDDPRLQAWAKEHGEAFDHYCEAVSTWRHEDGRMDPEALRRLAAAAENLLNRAKLVIGGTS